MDVAPSPELERRQAWQQSINKVLNEILGVSQTVNDQAFTHKASPAQALDLIHRAYAKLTSDPNRRAKVVTRTELEAASNELAALDERNEGDWSQFSAQSATTEHRITQLSPTEWDIEASECDYSVRKENGGFTVDAFDNTIEDHDQAYLSTEFLGTWEQVLKHCEH